MARDQVDMTPIETRNELVAWFEAGSKPKSQFRIGTEHEKFVFTVEGHRPVPYDGRRSIRALLEGMQYLLGWEPIVEDGNVIGLFDVTGGGAISLEPGGQFELSGAPVESVHQTVVGTDGASCAGQGSRATAGYWIPRTWHDAELELCRDPDNAQRALSHHDRLHAQGREVRSRYDVPHVHGADESGLLIRSRHGEEAAGLARAAAGGDGDVRQFTLHGGQTQRLSVVPVRDLARHRSRSLRHAAVGVRTGYGVRPVRRLRSLGADVFRQAG